MRDKKFYIDAIKMDLYRVVTAAGNLVHKVPNASVREFLVHADNDFAKIRLTKREILRRQELKELLANLDENMVDPHKRLRWAEKILTVRSRL